MSIELRTGFTGIVTQTADMQAPPGALERADNVCIRRHGLIEARPGTLEHATDPSIPANIIRLEAYEEQTLVACEGGFYDLDNGALVEYQPANGSTAFNPGIERVDLVPYAVARGNFYQGGLELGVGKWEGSGDFVSAGIPPLFASIAAAAVASGPTPMFLPTASIVAYSVVATRTDANGLIISSRPTGAIYVENASGANRNVFISITPGMTADVASEFEIYRTRIFASSVTPDDEMQLVAVVPWASSISYTDSLADINRGKTLYTSPSREGFEGSNDCPPQCGAMAVFKGALFFGNIQGPKRRTFSLNVSSTALTGVADGIGYRVYTASTTSGNVSMTLLSSTVGLEPGMRITGSGITPGLPVFIVSIVGTTITMSAPAGSNTVGASYTFSDQVSLDGGVSWQEVGVGLTAVGAFSALLDGSALAYRVTPPVGGSQHTFVAESVYRGAAATLQIFATHGDEYSPPLPTFPGTPDEGDQDILPNGLMASKPDEPEHVTLASLLRVGCQCRAILNLVATRDALFIVKEDGIWRLTGIPGQYRVDPFDLTTRCVLPGSVVAMRNRVYMLSNKGVVAISDAGVEIISAPIGEQLKPFVQRLLEDYETGYIVTNSYGYPGSASDMDNEYRLIVLDELEDGTSGIENATLVYNDETKAWTTWSFSTDGDAGILVATMAWNDRLGVMLIGQASPNNTAIRRFAKPAEVAVHSIGPYRSDGALGITIDGISPNVTFTPAYNVAVGDVILNTDTEQFYEVVAVVGPGEVQVEPAGIVVGNGVYIRPFTATVRPRPFVKPVQVMKQWTHLTAQFSRFIGSTSLQLESRSSVFVADEALTEMEMPISYAGTSNITKYVNGAAIRAVYPISSNRGWSNVSQLQWTCVYGAQELEAILVETKDGKTNVPNLEIGDVA